MIVFMVFWDITTKEKNIFSLPQSCCSRHTLKRFFRLDGFCEKNYLIAQNIIKGGGDQSSMVIELSLMWYCGQILSDSNLFGAQRQRQ